MQAKSLEEVLKIVNQKMESTIAAIKNEFKGIQIGRATPSFLANIKVDYYGVPTPISQIGNIAAPEPQLLTISPWEKNLLKEIERALLKANLGLSVSSDGNLIRAVMPPLTEERRKEYVKNIKKIGEDGKVAIRNVRRDGNDSTKKLGKDKIISQDQEKSTLEKIQKITDRHVELIDEVVVVKEKEIMTI